MGFEMDHHHASPTGYPPIDLPDDHQKSPASASSVGSPLSRTSSFNSIEPDALLAEIFSDDLDKLSYCLSEASSSDQANGVSTSVFYDIVQAQLALWTCVFSLMYSYAWRQHRKKFLVSILFVIPTVLGVCCLISALLTTIVIISRAFSTPFAYHDFLNMANEHNITDGRKRTFSGASSIASDDLLPKPLCRRHSSTSCCASRPPSRKLSYSYSHTAGSQELLDQNSH